jgi:hypothetical protein
MRKGSKYSPFVLAAKAEATELRRTKGVGSSHAHEIVARSLGYKTWISLLTAHPYEEPHEKI